MKKKRKNKGFFPMDNGDRFLIADVGATKVLLFLVRYEKGNPLLERKEEYMCKSFSSLEDVVQVFLKGDGGINGAAIGVPGLVKNQRCHLTNLSWVVSVKELAACIGIKNIQLVNDLELLGRGVPFLKEGDLICLQKGDRKDEGVKICISVGTGLGESIIAGGRILASEGGHADFAAATEEEIAFLQFMKTSLKHVSCEKILSGEGILNVYEYFSKSRDLTPEEIFQQKTRESRKAVDFFFRVLGGEIRNFALKTLPFGGIYLSGGLLIKNPLTLQGASFLDGFFGDDRLFDLLKSFPIFLLKGDKALLHGGIALLQAL